jgi:hypothetical protein
MHVNKSILALVAFALLGLTAAVAYMIGKSEVPQLEATQRDIAEQSAIESTGSRSTITPANQPIEPEKRRSSESVKPSVPAKGSAFSSTEQQLIDAYFKGEDMCRGSSDANAVEIWCPRRDAAYLAMTNAGICNGHESDQSAADYKIHRCRKGSIK